MSYVSEYRALLRANGLCINCKGSHIGPGMRCEPCAARNRGGRAVRRPGRRRFTDPGIRLGTALSTDSLAVTGSERQRVYNARSYWRRRVNETNRGEQ